MENARCVEDDYDMETLLSRCMARTYCTPPVVSKTLTSCDLTSRSDFIQVEYRCIPGNVIFWEYSKTFLKLQQYLA